MSLLYRNINPYKLVCSTIKPHLNGLKRDKEIWPEKFIITLKIPYTNKRSVYLEKNIKQLKSFTFSVAKRIVVFISSSMFAPISKDKIQTFNKSMVIYK